MLIAVEATRLVREVRGIGRYVRAMLPRLVGQQPGLKLMLFAKRRDATSLAEQLSGDPALRGAVEVRRVGEMARTPADVYWYPWNVLAPAPRHGASVVTVHDVAPVALPDPRWFSWRKNLRWRVRYRRSAQAATLMLADSAFTAAEIVRVLGVGAERVRVALLGADDLATSPPAGDAAALDRLGVATPFVLAVGAGERRKNHALLERAMHAVIASHREATLVFAGPRRKENGSTAGAPWSKHLGFVSDADLTVLYRNAAALAMPSTYEGFGLPVLEAMRLGTPVICAHASSLPEVAGYAALWVAPDDADGLASAISRVLRDEALRERLRAKGLRRSREFSWDETARRTLEAFDEARTISATA